MNAGAIADTAGISRVWLLNDLEVLAYAVPVLSGDELCVLQQGHVNRSGAIAIIAAGTGLGEAVLYPIGDRYVGKASEAGRTDFAARTERDITVLRALNARRRARRTGTSCVWPRPSQHSQRASAR